MSIEEKAKVVPLEVRQILENYLKEHGFTGLFREGCGCGFDDFMPCDGDTKECTPAYRRKCPGADLCADGAECESGGAKGSGCFSTTPNVVTNEQETDRLVEDAMRCDGCMACSMPGADGDAEECVRYISRLLQAERAKPKGDVWKDAPINATEVFTYYGIPGTDNVQAGPTFTRTLPKTRERQIAEERSKEYFSTGGVMPITEDEISDVIEAAILKAKAEWEAELKEAGT